MKRLLLIILLISGCLVSNAQSSRYSAFTVSGNVLVKHDSQWVTVSKRMPLDAFDELNIPEAGIIQIIENTTGCIYKNDNNGITTVRQLVKEAKAQSESSLSNLTKAFLKSMSTNPGDSSHPVSIGAAHRGTNMAVAAKDSVCSTIAYIASLLLESDLLVQDSTVTGNRIVNQDTYILNIENNSEKAYCVNVGIVNKTDRTCRLLLSPGYNYGLPYVILDAQTRVSLDDITCLFNPDERLFVFASGCIFDNEDVNTMLRTYPLSNGKMLMEMHYSEIR